MGWVKSHAGANRGYDKWRGPHLDNGLSPQTTKSECTLQVTSCVRGALRRAVLETAPRLVEAYLLCEVAAASEALAGLHGHVDSRFRVQVAMASNLMGAIYGTTERGAK